MIDAQSTTARPISDDETTFMATNLRTTNSGILGSSTLPLVPENHIAATSQSLGSINGNINISVNIKDGSTTAERGFNPANLPYACVEGYNKTDN